MKYYFQGKRTGAGGAPTNVVNEVLFSGEEDWCWWHGAPTNVVNEVLFSGEEDWCWWSAYKCCK